MAMQATINGMKKFLKSGKRRDVYVKKKLCELTEPHTQKTYFLGALPHRRAVK